MKYPYLQYGKRVFTDRMTSPIYVENANHIVEEIGMEDEHGLSRKKK